MSGLLEQLVARVTKLEAKIAELAKPRPKWIAVAAYAEERSIAESTVRAAVASGRLPAQQYGRTYKVAADVEIGEPVRLKPATEISDGDVVARAVAKGARR